MRYLFFTSLGISLDISQDISLNISPIATQFHCLTFARICISKIVFIKRWTFGGSIGCLESDSDLFINQKFSLCLLIVSNRAVHKNHITQKKCFGQNSKFLWTVLVCNLCNIFQIETDCLRLSFPGRLSLRDCTKCTKYAKPLWRIPLVESSVYLYVILNVRDISFFL